MKSLAIKLAWLIVRLRFAYLQIKNKNKISLGCGCRFFGVPIFSMSEDSEIVIGNNAIFRSHSRYNALGVNHPVMLSTLSSTAKIVIGNDVGMSGVSICAMRHIYIGDRVLIGVNVKIMDTDFHPISPVNRIYNRVDIKDCSGVNIYNNVFIGANTIILKGVSIGENSVIGAGSVVVKSIPENVIAAGNPCRVIRALSV